MSDAKSLVFDGAVGATVPARALPAQDYLIDPSRFPSEGNWAFCRLANEELPAVRLGFQRGGFNGGSANRVPSPSYLQLHLELMTRDGAILWLPSGVYPAERVVTDSHAMDIRFDQAGQNIFSMRGWPDIECHFRTDDGYAQADLRFELKAVTVLPDCILPHCLFAMWESMGRVSGSVRYRHRTVSVSGMVFFDHTRVIPRRHPVIARRLYVYTTLYFEDGSGMFGYHSLDTDGHPIEDYCFGVYVDAAGKGRFLGSTVLTRLTLDDDAIARTWHIAWRGQDFFLDADVTARGSRILRCWGSPEAPQARRDFSIIPLVLDAQAQFTKAGVQTALRGYGLAEYFNADRWPADQAAKNPGQPSPPSKV
jgi:hypothetical protein